ncbi:ATP-binding protein [Cellulomonas sp.]|uniref:ATP-binding protein n=1 Tax=Cellulomonas sp. TaxID=40001 RepID=UPI001B10DCBF|nr:ATP-binding protein [Cellulomonas sp.]MBO9554753.1 HAMP domain-containing protein [Cellulomonas sp.]
MSARRTGAAGRPSPGHRWRSRSLRLHLTVLTSGLLCVALVAGAVALTTVLSTARVAALRDVVTARSATVADLATGDRLPATLPVQEPGEIAQLLDADGHVLATSPNASATLPLLDAGPLADLRPSGDGVAVTTVSTGYDAEALVAVRGTTFRGEPATVVASVPLGEVRGLVRALRLSLVVVVPVLTLLLAWTIWLVLGRALRPVDQMRRAAAEVARSGGPGSLPVPRADDEIAALARTLNEMLDRLETSAARQRTFVADAAHELRSPLAALRASVDVARAHPESYGTGELAADLEREVLRMQALVDDLLLLARVGSAPTVRTEVDLGALAREVAEMPRTGAPVDVVGEGAGLGQAAALGRVVRNLVDNAARHAATRVRVTVADGSVVVEDDGRGIAEADRERVFERFVRLDDAREREAGGSGLGLAIAREVAREQAGDVLLGVSKLGGLRATLVVERP